MPLTKVSAGVIAANAVVDSFGTQSITGDKLGLTAINANNIVSGAVTGDKLGATSINANNIVGGTITTTQIASNTISNTNIQTGAIEVYSSSRSTGLFDGMRNRIINGAMVIDQRNAGASVTATTSIFGVDRALFQSSIASKFSIQQNAGAVTPPVGFTNYQGVTSLAATALGASDYYMMRQVIEGYNIADLGWGTANAKTVTLSFWVRSSLTGTFGGAFQNSAQDRSYPYTYTISVANTWEYKTVTVAGDTSGTWLSDNGVGIRLGFSLGTGSTLSGTAGAWSGSSFFSATGATSVVGTNGATFYITGVQLEVGSTATSFDYRPIGTELALCQRYALKYNTDAIVYAFIGTGYATSTTNANISLPLPVQMRTAPTVTASTLMVQDGTTITAVTATAVVTNQTNSLNAFVQATVASGLTAFRPYQLQTNNSTSGNLLLSAEL